MPLNHIYKDIQDELLEVERLIAKTLKAQGDPRILAINEYVLATPGKRLRPALAIFSFRSLSGAEKPSEDVVRVAAAIELIHQASLIHDDIIDDAPTRHNKPSIQKQWGQHVAITVGVLYYSMALKLISLVGKTDVLNVVSDAVQHLCEGELWQIMERDNPHIQIAGYLDMLRKKTAVLFAAACKTGAMLAGASVAKQNALEEFGANLGIVFQIADDYLDIMGDEKQLKKAPGQDFDKGEVTLPILYLLETAPKSDRSEILRLISSKDEKSLLLVRAKLQKSQAPQLTKKLALEFLGSAGAKLDELSSSNYKNGLQALTRFVKERGFK